MDKLINMGKEYLQNQGQQGGQNDNNNGGGGGGDDVFAMAKQHASQMAGSSGDSDLFGNIAGALGQNQHKIANEDIDEQDVVDKHKQVYQEDGHGDENALGTAAATQALKMFNQGGSSGGGQAAFLGMAMSEASKLFDDKAAQGKVTDGASKENVVQKAGEMAMKMYFKSQMGSGGGGLMGMAGKFFG